jgi:hypothetical protein
LVSSGEGEIWAQTKRSAPKTVSNQSAYLSYLKFGNMLTVIYKCQALSVDINDVSATEFISVFSRKGGIIRP